MHSLDIAGVATARPTPPPAAELRRQELADAAHRVRLARAAAEAAARRNSATAERLTVLRRRQQVLVERAQEQLQQLEVRLPGQK